MYWLVNWGEVDFFDMKIKSEGLVMKYGTAVILEW